LHGPAFLFAVPQVMSTNSWTRLTQSSRWGSFQACYRLCLVDIRLAPHVAGSDSPPRSHVSWNGSRRADNPDMVLRRVSDATPQAPIRLLESTIPLTGPVALTGLPRFITAEASGCVFGTRTSPLHKSERTARSVASWCGSRLTLSNVWRRTSRQYPSSFPGGLSVLTDRSCSSQLLDGASGLSHFYPVETLDVLWSARYPCRHSIDSIPFKGPTEPPSFSILGSFVRLRRERRIYTSPPQPCQ